MGHFFITILLVFGFWQNDAFAKPKSNTAHCVLADALPQLVASIDDYGVFNLEGGARAKLADVFFPLDPLSGAFLPETLAQIKTLVSQRPVYHMPIGPKDRYQRQPSYMFIVDRTGRVSSLQTILVRNQRAHFMPDPQLKKNFATSCDVVTLRHELLEIEQKTYKNNKESTPHQVPVHKAQSQKLWSLEGEFVIVRGSVTEVRTTKRGVSINFGDDWKKDFTAYLSPLVSQSFKDQKKMNSNLVGQRIQLRGFLDLYYGPSMRIDHLMQMEMLSE